MTELPAHEGVVMVTGGAGEIGAGVTRFLADKGYLPVVILDVQDDAGTMLADEVGGDYLRHDVTRVGEWQANSLLPWRAPVRSAVW